MNASTQELSTARAQYEELLGCEVSIDVANRRLVTWAGRAMDAVVLPARLGDRVLAELRFAMLDGPVAAAPGGQWMTFLTAPAAVPNPFISYELRRALELRRARMQLMPRGGQVVLPRPAVAHDDPREWRWVEAPRPGRPLPPWCAVVAAVKRAVTW